MDQRIILSKKILSMKSFLQPYSNRTETLLSNVTVQYKVKVFISILVVCLFLSSICQSGDLHSLPNFCFYYSHCQKPRVIKVYQRTLKQPSTQLHSVQKVLALLREAEAQWSVPLTSEILPNLPDVWGGKWVLENQVN